jgi:hypothetical protein
MIAVFTAARRHPITFFLIIWNPVLLMIIVSAVMPLVKAKPPVPEVLTPAMLADKGFNTSILVAIQPRAVISEL